MEYTMESVTIDEMEAVSRLILEKRTELEELNAVKKRKDQELADLEMRMMGLLAQSGKQSYSSNVGLISVSYRESVRVPQDLEAKRQFFEYLREKGIFEELVSVNSQTLNAFYKAEKKAAEEAGNFMFELPGIGEPSRQEILSFRKSK